MISIEQVLSLVHSIFARQINREANEYRAQLLLELCDALSGPQHDRLDTIGYVLREASRCGDVAVEARATRALKILDVIDAVDALDAHKREERDARMLSKDGAR